MHVQPNRLKRKSSERLLNIKNHELSEALPPLFIFWFRAVRLWGAVPGDTLVGWDGAIFPLLVASE